MTNLIASVTAFVWPSLLFACFVAFIVVTTMLMQARKTHDSESPPPSIANWVLLTVVGGGVWAIVTGGFGFILGVGHGGGRIAGLILYIALFSGPALYLYIAFGKTKTLQQLLKRQSIHSSPDDGD